MQPELEARLLAAMPATIKELAEDFGYSHVWIWKGVQDMRSRKQCFVLRWARSGRTLVPVFMAGCLKDRPKPPPLPRGPTRKANAQRKAAQAKGPFAALFQ